MVRTILLAAMLTAGTALAAQAGEDFLFSPAPRWQDEPETEALCAAMRQECAAIISPAGDVDRDVEYDELFDAAGNLRGIRVTSSSGCRALDEYAELSARHFIRNEHHDFTTEPGEYGLELPAGTSPEGVRLVHHNSTTNAIGCGGG